MSEIKGWQKVVNPQRAPVECAYLETAPGKRRNPRIRFRAPTVKAWNLLRYKSADIYVQPNSSVVLIQFREDNQGQFKPTPCQCGVILAIGSAIRALNRKPTKGQYKAYRDHSAQNCIRIFFDHKLNSSHGK